MTGFREDMAEGDEISASVLFLLLIFYIFVADDELNIMFMKKLSFLCLATPPIDASSQGITILQYMKD